MSDKKTKRPVKTLARNLLLGIPTNIAAGPLGFRAELDVDPKDKQSPGPSRIVFHKREGETEGLAVPETSTYAVLSDDIEPTNPLTICVPAEDTVSVGQEEGGSRVTQTEEGPEKTTRGDRAITSGTPEEVTNGFGPLKTLLESIAIVYATHNESVAIGNKVTLLLLHINSLDALFSAPPGNVPELERRDELILKLKNVEGQLQSLSGEPGFRQLVDEVQCDVFGLLGDLQEAIFNYQMTRRTVIDDRGSGQVEPAEAATIKDVQYAKRAEYRHGNRNGCLKGTRGAILDKIELWTHDFNQLAVYWLNGLAGTGKTTIAQTVAERAFADGRLGASFFCSRDFEDRRNLEFIFPTLAVQLARRYTEFRSIFVQAVRSDPDIVGESLYGQMDKLIVQPLAKSAIPTVIVIDALDECRDDEPASAILSILGQFVDKIPKVKFFVTGRPEPRIQKGFQLPPLANVADVFVLHEVETSQVSNDIRLFFGHNFSKIKGHQRGLADWPTGEQLDLLCKRAAGLFIYAVATVRFINQQSKNPKRQLDRLLQSLESGFEGRIKLAANVTLDLLYVSILEEAFGDDDPEDDHRLQSILGAVILAVDPLPPSTIATLFGLDAEDVLPPLLSLRSLLILKEDRLDHPIKPFHKSFPDFITNPTRCSNPRFCVSPCDQHTEILVGCLELMNQKLEQNMCRLPMGVANSDVNDLKERTEKHIGQALQYACRAWYKHLISKVPSHKSKITPLLHHFLERKFLFWLEVLSVLGIAKEGVNALKVAEKWLDASPTLTLIKDYLYFVVTFFEVICTSAPHIYHSALLLSPQTSLVYKLYKSYIHPLTRVVQGLPVVWEPFTASRSHSDYVIAATWSLCNRFIAIAWEKSKMTDICDATTLRRLNTFLSPRDGSFGLWLGFSSDGHFLIECDGMKIITWDLQTGSLVGTASISQVIVSRISFSCTLSMDGKELAYVSWNNYRISRIYISVYNLPSQEGMTLYGPQGAVVSVWTHGGHIQFATLRPGFITVWEVGFSLNDAPAEVRSLPIPDEVKSVKKVLFFPILSQPQVAFALKAAVLVWDAQNSKILLNFVGEGVGAMTFSPDGSFFACVTGSMKLSVWKVALTGYTLHQRIIWPMRGPVFSPSCESILIHNYEGIHLLSTRDPTPLSNAQTQSVDWAHFIMEFSPERTLAAFAVGGRNTVIILDLKSGNLLLTANAGVPVHGLRVTGSTIIVVGEGKVITWSLPAEDYTPPHADTTDSIQTVTFDHSGYYSSTTISSDLKHMAILSHFTLSIYNISTGSHLASVEAELGMTPCFSPDGHEVWCASNSSTKGWSVVKHPEFGSTSLKPLETIAHPLGTFPWQSSNGYEITNDGWVLNSMQKQLVWLPHHWRSNEKHRTWNGGFLGLLHGVLQEAVILEFLE